MRYSLEEKAMWVSGWKESGKSAWKYAKENGLNPQTFIKWTKAEKESLSCFVELPSEAVYLQRTQPISIGAEILIEKGDVKIHIPLVLSRDELRAVMEGLGATL
jgi:transposase-like protein